MAAGPAPRVPRRLVVGSHDDDFEREADEIARRVVASLSRPSRDADTALEPGPAPPAGALHRTPSATAERTIAPTSYREQAIGTGRSKIALSQRGKVIGSVVVNDVDETTCEATNLRVDAEHRGEGHGTELMKAAAHVGARSGKSRVTLGSQDDGSGHLDRWYTTLGFRASGAQPDGFTRFEAPTGVLRASRIMRSAVRPPADDVAASHEPRIRLCDDASGAVIRRMEALEEPTTGPDLVKLMVRQGTLGDLDGRLLRVWPSLAAELTTAAETNEANIALVSNLGYLPCGVVLVNREGCFIRPDVYGVQGELDSATQSALMQFVLDFMQSNKQLGYLQRQQWFLDGSYEVAIDVNFYPNRGLAAGGLGVHKDTAGENLFVNLIFNNAGETPNTEWTEDTALPDEVRFALLDKQLPPALLKQLLEAKALVEQSSDEEKGTFRGGLSGANAFVSFVDELIWHSSPSREYRATYDPWIVFTNFNRIPKSETTYDAMVVMSQTPGNPVHDAFGHDPRNFTLAAWRDHYDKVLKPSREKLEALRAAIQNFDWPAHKKMGATGMVLNDPQNLTNIPAPTMAQGRSRANSKPEMLKKVNEAAPPDAKRTFIRTWVRVVPTGTTK
jgi:ribosomal protein S18 acetylase RimI-like enzyme